MNIKIQAIHFTLDDALKDFIDRKVNKLILIDDRIINANVYLKIDKADSYENKVVEMKIHSSDGDYFAKKKSNTFEESTDLVCQALRKQILKHK